MASLYPSYRQVDVHALRLARDLNAIAKRRDGAMGPAAAAVLSRRRRATADVPGGFGPVIWRWIWNSFNVQLMGYWILFIWSTLW